MGRNGAGVDSSFGAASDVPAIQIDQEDDIVHQRVHDGHLDPRNHGALLVAPGIFLPRTTVLLDHSNELNVARHDGGNGGDQTGTEQKEAQAGHIKQGAGIAKPRRQERRLDICGGEGIEHIEAPGEDVKGDGEVHDRGMDWSSA